jgi:hypothetical protein
MLANPGFLDVTMFPVECSISFNFSLRSDHAGLLLAIPLSLDVPPPADRPGWKIEDRKKDEWITLFCSYPLSPVSPVDDASLRHLTQRIDEMIAETSSSLFQKPCLASCGLLWWNNSCKLAIASLHGVHSDEQHSVYKALHLTVTIMDLWTVFFFFFFFIFHSCAPRGTEPHVALLDQLHAHPFLPVHES